MGSEAACADNQPALTARGMKPYYDHAGITIYHGDCREVMPGLKGQIDIVATDPPYGLGFRSESWDSCIPEWWLESARAIAPVVVFTTAPTTMWDYPRPDWVLCWYRPASSSRSPSGGFNHWSPVLVYGNGAPSPDSINLHAIQHAQYRGFAHPSPKPLALYRWLIKAWEGVVLDPFMGSGTALRAAKDLGRRAIGIEIEEKYCEIAAKRLSQEVFDW